MTTHPQPPQSFEEFWSAPPDKSAWQWAGHQRELCRAAWAAASAAKQAEVDRLSAGRMRAVPSANQVRERLADVDPELLGRLDIDFLVAGILAGDIKIVTFPNPFPEVGGEFISVVVPHTAVWP